MIVLWWSLQYSFSLFRNTHKWYNLHLPISFLIQVFIYLFHIIIIIIIIYYLLFIISIICFLFFFVFFLLLFVFFNICINGTQIKSSFKSSVTDPNKTWAIIRIQHCNLALLTLQIKTKQY